MGKQYDRVEIDGFDEENGVTTGTVYYDGGNSMKFRTGVPSDSSQFREDMNEAVEQAREQSLRGTTEDHGQVYENHFEMESGCTPGGGRVMSEAYADISEENSQDQEMKSGNEDMSNEENLRDPSSWDL